MLKEAKPNLDLLGDAKEEINYNLAAREMELVGVTVFYWAADGDKAKLFCYGRHPFPQDASMEQIKDFIAEMEADDSEKVRKVERKRQS